MEFFYTTNFSVPIYQIGLLLAISTLTMLFGRIKLALLVNYLFTLYWGYILNRDIFTGDQFENVNSFSAIYFGFGIIIVMLALFAFMTQNE